MSYAVRIKDYICIVRLFYFILWVSNSGDLIFAIYDWQIVFWHVWWIEDTDIIYFNPHMKICIIFVYTILYVNGK